MIFIKLIKSTIILIIGGFFTKMLGMVIKVFVTRIIGEEGIGMYMLLLPTFMLFISIASLGLPIAISKLVSEDRIRSKRIVVSSLPIVIVVNTVLIFVILLIAPLLCRLLHEPRLYYPIVSIGLTLPFISISSIIRGYFFGKERMVPHVSSNVFEQIVRLGLIVFVIPFLLPKGIMYAVCGVVLVNIVSELASIIVLLFFIPKGSINKKDIKVDKGIMRDILSIGIPSTGSRIIGSIGYFFEPIILTSVLIFSGYSNEYIVSEYGVITGYVMPLLMLPAFFTSAISSALLPVISKGYSKGHTSYIRTKLKQSIGISLSIGVLFTGILLINPGFFLKLLYNTSKGVLYLKVMAPLFLVYYIQAPITTTLQGLNKSSEAFFSTLSGIVIKVVLLFVLCLCHIGLYGLIIATSINIVYVTMYNYVKVSKVLKGV